MEITGQTASAATAIVSSVACYVGSGLRQVQLQCKVHLTMLCLMPPQAASGYRGYLHNAQHCLSFLCLTLEWQMPMA